jgi:dihydropteroate synthase
MKKIQQLLLKKRPLVMGVLNTTPDSFSDGGQFNVANHALKHVQKMIDEGADIIDVGGESTRPGAAPVTTEDELQRVIPVIKAIREQSQIAISIDTSKAEVMKAAVKAGADMVNDVNALRAEEAVNVCAQLDVSVCLMHMQGEPGVMQENPEYKNVVDDIKQFLQQRIEVCVQAGIKKEQIILDPGFGFGKTLDHNLSLLKHLNEFSEIEYPLLIGLSRKSMLGMILDADVDERLFGSVAAAVLAQTQGAKIFRVHDVKPTVDALKVCQAVSNAE